MNPDEEPVKGIRARMSSVPERVNSRLMVQDSIYQGSGVDVRLLIPIGKRVHECQDVIDFLHGQAQVAQFIAVYVFPDLRCRPGAYVLVL